jgi:addiction module HigA family antidote
LPDISPGEVLKEEFLDPVGLTPERMATDTGVPRRRIEAILAGEEGITADVAMRFGRYFGTSAQLWLNLQSSYELEQAGISEAHSGEEWAS